MQFRILSGLFLLSAAALGSPAAEAGPVGPEFRINTTTINDQRGVTTAPLTSGGFVVTWYSDGQDGSRYGCYGQRFDPDGTPAGGEFPINTFTRNDQQNRSVAGLETGDFVVVWESRKQDGSLDGIYSQRFRGNGKKAGGEVRVNTYAAFDQLEPDVEGLADGGYVVVWQSQGQDGSGFGIFGQRFAADGRRVGGEFRVNTVTAGDQIEATVAGLGDGGFIVAWGTPEPDGSFSDVFAQRYAADGKPAGAAFMVNTETFEYQGFPEVAALNGGDFVVTWSSYLQDGSDFGIYARRYRADGKPLGQEFRVNTETHLDQIYSEITPMQDGGFVVVWTSQDQDGSETGIYGQRYTATGRKVGREFRANSFTADAQEFAAVAGLGAGGFVVVWRSTGQDGSGTGIYGQRFAP